METHLKVASYLTNLLDTKYKIGKFRFGLDPLLGIIPGLGDIAAFILGLYIVGIGIRMELPNDAISKMVGNLITDLLLGSIPVIGDLADVVFKANVKNLEIIKKYKKGKVIIDAEYEE